MSSVVKKVTLISLGCEKNLVDSEMILGFVRKGKVEIINDINKADIIIINTCGILRVLRKKLLTLLSIH